MGMAALQRHGLKDQGAILHVGYARNTLAVENAVADLLTAETGNCANPFAEAGGANGTDPYRELEADAGFRRGLFGRVFGSLLADFSRHPSDRVLAIQLAKADAESANQPGWQRALLRNQDSRGSQVPFPWSKPGWFLRTRYL